MMHDDERQEFFHIRNMVLERERLVQSSEDVNVELPVMQPEYWRNRINALLARQAVSRTIVAQASVLLMKLDGTTNALKNAR
ncbi:hypothetical protein PPGU19_062060 (plasmid) [Paraburkholderia sp. PGU19]|uniref:hypothetical protein n=1 Tax=Paraburkholderia sp. PGU19 TaxID=2735434 RepID=UPI0015DA77D1|nr:hypothetical protein [Paraburkholderia sp. PGU19]BCG01638.1 hypothetical protein PPGU19_062060 [Paraburkholderia sp. PGU19]